MTIEELREEFEEEYRMKIFNLHRDTDGNYISSITFQAWGAYKLCASKHGLLPLGFDIYSKEAR